MSFFIFLFFLLSIIFSEKIDSSQSDKRKLQTAEEYSNIRIHINYDCLTLYNVKNPLSK